MLHSHMFFRVKIAVLQLVRTVNWIPSDMFGNCPVKRLLEKDMITFLRVDKEYLQTAGLITDDKDFERQADLLVRCGVNRIMKAGHMSNTFSRESHDCEYSLRRYVRIVNIE